MVTEFKLDIDTPKARTYATQRWFRRILKVIAMLDLEIYTKDIRVMTTQHGFHVYLKTERYFTALEICMIQSLMGSDYKREIFNLLRIKQGCENWNVLFSNKYQYDVETKKLVKISEEKVIS